MIPRTNVVLVSTCLEKHCRTQSSYCIPASRLYVSFSSSCLKHSFFFFSHLYSPPVAFLDFGKQINKTKHLYTQSLNLGPEVPAVRAERRKLVEEHNRSHRQTFGLLFLQTFRPPSSSPSVSPKTS